jgi:hypothetical protein
MQKVYINPKLDNRDNKENKVIKKNISSVSITKNKSFIDLKKINNIDIVENNKIKLKKKIKMNKNQSCLNIKNDNIIIDNHIVRPPNSY